MHDERQEIILFEILYVSSFIPQIALLEIISMENMGKNMFWHPQSSRTIHKVFFKIFHKIV